MTAARILAGLALVTLTACVVPGRPADVAIGPAFETALRDEYVALAEVERSRADWADTAFFTARGNQTAAGFAPPPQPAAERRIAADMVGDLDTARGRIERALRRGGPHRAPALTAHAQAMYECWLEEGEEGIQEDRIADCRDGFETAMAEVEAALLGATVFVLLPEPDGSATAITIDDGKGVQVLNQPLAAAQIDDAGQLASVRVDDTDVDEVFGAALGARPIAPSRYVVYFQFDTDEPTAESRALLPDIRDDIARRPVAEVVLIGHTDRAGDLDYNDRLSSERAQALRQWLVERGIVASSITTVSGRGERDLLVQTEDGVREERNRRVVVIVR
jgi:OOP family OmpA-OmpF porin